MSIDELIAVRVGEPGSNGGEAVRPDRSGLPGDPRAAMHERRLQHIRRHLKGIRNDHEVIMAMVPLLTRPLTLQAVADELGPGWTRRQVEYNWFLLRERLLLQGFDQGRHGNGLSRLALYRLLNGDDPCWCED